MSKKVLNKASKPRSIKLRGAEHELLALFWVLSPAYGRWIEYVCGKSGTTAQRLRLISLLCEQGPMMMSGLRDQMGITATNVTALIDSLEKDGRVKRQKHPTDRRATLINVTEETRKIFANNICSFRSEMAAPFAIFNHREQQQLLSYLERLRDSLIERGVLEIPQSKHVPTLCSK